jgi:hypothetical protein
MADPIYASPMIDPQTAINQLSTLYTSEYLTENYNTFFNDKTDSERLTYMPEGYEDQIDFDPFQSDYGLDFKSTLESEGFVNYVKNKPVRAAPQLATGPTVTVGGGVLSAEELRRRMAGPIEDRSVYLDEVLPFYPGQEEGEGSVFDYWKSIPNISSFSEGLRGSLYGVTQRQKEEEEAAPVATGGGAPQPSRPLFSPGGHPGPSGSFSSGIQSGFMGMTSDGTVGFSAINQAHANQVAAANQAEAEGIDPSAVHGQFGVASPTPTAPTGTPVGVGGGGTGVPGTTSGTPAGIGGGGTGVPGTTGNKKHGGKITTQMNNLKKGGLAVAEPNKDASWFIRELQSKEGSDVQVLKDDGKLVGAIDMNDPNRHFIIDMVDFDSKLGIIEPHEMAMAADPRTAGQLDRKRNWDARIQKLLEIQEMQPGRAVTETVPPVDSVQDKQDPDVVPNIEQILAAEQPAPPAVESERLSPVRPPVVGQPPAARPRVEFPASEPRSAEPAARQPVEYPASQPDDTRAIAPAAVPITVQTEERTPYVDPGPKQGVIRSMISPESLIAERAAMDRKEPQVLVPPRQSFEEFRQGEIAKQTEEPFVQEPEPSPITDNIMDNLIQKESSDKPDSVGDDGQSIGLGQVKIETARNPGFGVEPLQGSDEEIKQQLLDPVINRKFSQAYLTGIFNTYSNIIHEELNFAEYKPSDTQILILALQAYNSRPSTILSILQSFKGKFDIQYSDIKDAMKNHKEFGNDLFNVTTDYATSIVDPKDLQVGGQVPQINRSGLIQGEGSQVSDSIPMQAEPNSFIVNAPAVQMAGGAKKLDSMVNAVQKQQQTSGFNQFGNPVTGTQDINVSNGEYKIGKQVAKKIGYNKLNKLNNVGKPFVDQLDQRGYAEGDKVKVPLPVRKPKSIPMPVPKPEMLNISGVDTLFSRADRENLINLLYTEDPTGKDSKKILDVIFNRIAHANRSEQRAKDFGSGDVTNILSKRGQFSPVHRVVSRKDTGESTLEFKRKPARRLRKATPEALANIERIVNEQLDHIRTGTYESDVGDSTYYRNVDESAPDEWWDTALTPFTVGEGGHTFYEIKDSDSFVPMPISKPELPNENRSFVSSPNKEMYAQIQPDEPVNLLDVKPQTEKEEKDKSFVGSNISTGTRTLPQQDWDIPFEKWRQEQVQQ